MNRPIEPPDRQLTESINKQYSKYGSLRTKEKEKSKIELCNAEDPMKFLTRIDSSIKDAKARVKKSIDNSSISEDYESSFDQQPNDNIHLQDTIPMVKLDSKTKLSIQPAATKTTIAAAPTTVAASTLTANNNKTLLPNSSSSSSSN